MVIFFSPAFITLYNLPLFLFIEFSNKVCPSAMKVLQFLLRYSLWQCVHDTANNNFTPAKKDYGCAGTFLNFTYENEVFDNDYS